MQPMAPVGQPQLQQPLQPVNARKCIVKFLYVIVLAIYYPTAEEANEKLITDGDWYHEELEESRFELL